MAETLQRHVLHRRSNVYTTSSITIGTESVSVNLPKAPTSAQIEYGELAVNYGKGNEAAFIRNSDNEIVQLNDIKNIRYTDGIDNSFLKYLNSKFGSGKVGSGYTSVVYPKVNDVTKPSGVTPVAANDAYDDAFHKLDSNISALTQEVINDELTTAQAVDALATASGTKNASGEIAYTGATAVSNYLTASTDVTDALLILDSAIKDNIVTDISQLSDSGNTLDCKFVNASGDTMFGSLNIADGTSCSSVGTTKISLNTDGTSSFGGNMTVSGTISATSSIHSSDERLKENIDAISDDDIEKVSKVDFKQYNFIADDYKVKKYGVIAQQLESVGLNNLVSEGEDGIKGVDYISFLILKIQQLEKQVQYLTDLETFRNRRLV